MLKMSLGLNNTQRGVTQHGERKKRVHWWRSRASQQVRRKGYRERKDGKDGAKAPKKKKTQPPTLLQGQV